MRPGAGRGGAVPGRPFPAWLGLCLVLLLNRGALVAAQVLPLSGPGAGSDWVLDQEDLRGFEPLSLEDVVRHLVGVAVSRRGALGSLEYLNVAGTPSGRVLLGLDGIDLGEPEYAYPRLYAVPIAIVDQVHVFWSTDPVRIEIWTQREAATAPTTAIDLGRGDLTTRVRRLQFVLPPRVWWVGARYDELLRQRDDFRPGATGAPAPELGAYDGRGRMLALGFERGRGEGLRLLLADFFDNAHGSYASQSEITGSTRVLGSLRWWRPLGEWALVLDLSQQAWERTRHFVDGTQQIQESHGSVGMDLTSPEAGSVYTALRLRAASVEGERTTETQQQRGTHQRYDAELQIGGGGRSVHWNTWLGTHGHTQFGSAWSGRVHLEMQRALWIFSAQGGRGVSFAGWGEERRVGDEGRRPALFASAGVRREAGALQAGLSAFFKKLDEPGRATLDLFPQLGTGPTRIAGALAQGGLQDGTGRIHWALDTRLAWLPTVEGQRSGLPEGQAEVLGRWAWVDLFDGDLSIHVRVRWRLESRRPFEEGLELAPYAAGDARLDLRILRRLMFYWDVQNVTDTAFEIHPQVLFPGRLSLFGVRVELFD